MSQMTRTERKSILIAGAITGAFGLLVLELRLLDRYVAHEWAGALFVGLCSAVYLGLYVMLFHVFERLFVRGILLGTAVSVAISAAVFWLMRSSIVELRPEGFVTVVVFVFLALVGPPLVESIRRKPSGKQSAD